MVLVWDYKILIFLCLKNFWTLVFRKKWLMFEFITPSVWQISIVPSFMLFWTVPGLTFMWVGDKLFLAIVLWVFQVLSLINRLFKNLENLGRPQWSEVFYYLPTPGRVPSQEVHSAGLLPSIEWRCVESDVHQEVQSLISRYWILPLRQFTGLRGPSSLIGYV